ncbi:CPBP family glutamic-type intramembrane protease [Frateuria defendens]|uniref:CPBP family glutamic-type intramembrane protease n=1 Tax=Frateuria defendens TaxID=2219559 RepID=UPI00066FEC80|nr:CPBP family intramembrane glutamic endopeptidase [Frateuria defendens]
MRRLAPVAGLALALVLALLALRVGAARLTAAHLLAEAGQELAQLQAGQPLWQWQPRQPDDFVAGRAFGQAKLVRDAGGIRAVSLDGSPFELGLPIAQGLDLAHWPWLDLDMVAETPAALELIWQAGSTEPPCLAAVGPLRPGTARQRIDLRRLAWRSADGDCALPPHAWMLRLRLTLPPGRSLRLLAAALHADSAALGPAVGTTDGISVPPGLPTGLARIDLAATTGHLPAVPLFRLPAGASAEDQLALRDRARLYRPAALVAPADAAIHPQAEARAAGWPAWTVCAAYLLALLALARWKPAGAPGTWLEILAIAAGALWLIAGLQWGGHPAPPATMAFVAALLYAAWAEWRRRPRDWHGSAPWPAWAWSLALVPAALALVGLWGHAFVPVPARHALTYLGWAALQQWLLLAVLMRRLESVLPRPSWAIVPTAVLFALLHTPNGMLMQLCLVAELWWAWGFRRWPGLLPVAMAHAACALLVESGLAGSALLRSMEVSARFFL